jgi:hypothetical protein
VIEEKDKKKSFQEIDGLMLTKQQTAWASSAVILFSFVIFMSGYFLGERKASQDFSYKVDQDVFADKISASMYALYDTKGDIDESDDQEDSGSAVAATLVASDEIKEQITATREQEIEASTEVAEREDNQTIIKAPTKPNSKHYFAELIGFGTESAAQAFVKKLRSQKIPVKIAKRTSKTARGRALAWYQVITENFDSLPELKKLTDTLAKQERLKGVKVVTS